MIKKLCWSLMLGQSLLWAPIWGSPVLLPSPADAYTAQDALTVYWLAGEDYAALARRAELAARTAAQRRFDTDILLTRVVITVLGQNGGQAAPILTLDVGRNDWRNRPDPRYWARYYRSSPTLLGLEGVAPTGTLQNEPRSAPAASPVAPSPPPAELPAVKPSKSPAPGAAPGQAPGSNPGSSTNRPAPAGGSPEALPSPDSVNPPAIKLPAVPAGVGIPAILR